MKAFMTDPAVRRIAMMLVVVMGVISFVPRVEASFVPSNESFSPSSRQEDMATIQKALEQKLVKERLRDLGYTDEEIRARLGQLSDTELHNLATRLDAVAVAGGGFKEAVEVAGVILLLLILLALTILGSAFAWGAVM